MPYGLLLHQNVPNSLEILDMFVRIRRVTLCTKNSHLMLHKSYRAVSKIEYITIYIYHFLKISRSFTKFGYVIMPFSILDNYAY